MAEERDSRTAQVIGLAIDVHRELGPGLLESAYEQCLCYELQQAGVSFQRQVPLPVRYKAVNLECGYRLDVVVDGSLVLEIKAIERLLPIHDAQMLSYLKLGGFRVGLLLNFHSPVLKNGNRRLVV
ncbi:MAG: GxxExxY protein [Rhodospirillaceae bacterium]|nr:GxxExxY protein [Rhodospirillaceae bacterium]